LLLEGEKGNGWKPSMSAHLSDSFLRNVRVASSESSELEPALERILRSAAAAWPGIELSHESFVAHLAELLRDEPDPIAALAAIHAEDVYLAWACANGDPRALSMFEEKFLPQATTYVRRMMRSADSLDEFRTLLRERLFVGSHGAGPKIASYRGRGSLWGWLRVAAFRVGKNLLRREKDRPDRDRFELGDVRSPLPDPELAFVKGRYAKEFKAAFQTTLSALSSDERAVLRFYYLDGMTVQAIGKLYRVHASTITRWIARAREQVLVETNRLLAKRLDLAPNELRDVVGLIDSQLELSMRRCLQDSSH
jgi:RNA polymerase sigma-70 factor, ECF subfamily